MRLLVLTLFLLGPVPTVSFAQTSGGIKIGEILPETPMQGLNGRSRKLSEYLGKPLIINVWASWCGPCRAEMASLENLARRNDAGDFNVIGVSVDDYPERAKALLKASNATITHFIDYRLRIEKMLGASRLPLTVLVTADGYVIAKIYGARKWDSPRALKRVANAFGNPLPPD